MKKYIVMVCIFLLTLTGCSKVGETAELLPIPKDTYQKTEYTLADVTKGDLEPVIKFNLRPLQMEQTYYSIDISDVEIEEINVSVGDHVSKGQVLVTFKSDEIRKNIIKYEADYKQAALLLEHYEKLAKVDTQDKIYTGMRQKDIDKIYEQKQESEANKKANYEVEIGKLKDDLAIAKTYLEEEYARLASCRIVASEDGVITFVSKYLVGGNIEPGIRLLAEASGQNEYAVSTDDDYDFQIGQIYTAKDDSQEYDVIVTNVKPNDEGGRFIIFEPTDAIIDPTDAHVLELEISKGIWKDVISVDKKAVYQKEDGSAYVFLVTDEGFLLPKKVTIGERVDNRIIVKEGLDGNEKIAIR